MILDEVDLKILREFCRLQKKETTTWQIMKRIYYNGRDKEHNTIKRRIEKMASYGFFLVNGKPKSYTLLGDIVKLKKFKFPDKTSKGICLKIEGKWEIIEL